MDGGKIVSGIVALAIYLSIIFLVLFFYNIHQTKAKNYVEKNADRVTVTLVNSNKTVFNHSDKVTTPKKTVSPIPTIIKNIPKKKISNKHISKRVEPTKVVPKKRERASRPIPKPKHIVVPKKTKQVVPKKIAPKKHIPKKIPKKVIPKKPKKVISHPVKKHIPKKPKKSAKDLFSSIKTKVPVKKHSVKKVPQKQPVHRPSSIKHNSSITDRLRATHQSGRVSNSNRTQGVENAYIAKVKQRMNNWDAVGMRGQWVTINLTIFQSGKFRYTSSGVSGAMRNSLTQYMRTLNNMGLGRHTKSTPYSIQVRFRVN